MSILTVINFIILIILLVLVFRDSQRANRKLLIALTVIALIFLILNIIW